MAGQKFEDPEYYTCPICEATLEISGATSDGDKTFRTLSCLLCEKRGFDVMVEITVEPILEEEDEGEIT